VSGPDLPGLLESLSHPTDGGPRHTFSSVIIPGSEPHRLGRSITGDPALLLVSTASSDPTKRPPPIRLEHLAVQHEVQCRIWSADEGSVEEVFTVIQCTSPDIRLRRQFLTISESLLTTLGSAPNAVDVQNAVSSLVELFRALALPQKHSVQGLWAELFLIARGEDPALLVSSWHATPEDRYDFNAGSERIEVKSASSRVRRHRFSLEQLEPPPGSQLIVVSLFTERSGAGATILDLVTQARSRLNGRADLQLRLETMVARTLGDGYSRAMEVAFDLQLATESLAFFAHATVPRITGKLPSGVSDVSFIADLSGVHPLSARALDGALSAAARPKVAG
jgi:hypothetical protein